MFLGIAYPFLSEKFEQLGRKIPDYASRFLLTPIFMTLIFATGLQRFRYDVGDSVLVISGGLMDTYQSHLSKIFPMDLSSDFEPGRSLELGRFGTVIVRAADRKTVLRKPIFEEIIHLDQVIRKFIFIADNEIFRYEDICAKNDGECFQNKILHLEDKIEEVENRTFLLEYPAGDNSNDYNILALGGVTIDDDNHILSAETLRLVYFLDNTGKWKEEIARQWEKAFIDTLGKMKFDKIAVVKDISTSREESSREVLKICKEYIPYSTVIILLFTVVTCIAPDFLRSKPWTGILSAISTGMSVVSGFGLLLYLKILPSHCTISVPFLVLGIGMDDTFVMLSAWMKSDTKKTLQDRMAETYSESGVSITITSFTNIVSFAVGAAFAPFSLLSTFCMFMATCLAFDYIYQITFVGASLSLCGKMEELQLHSLTFLPLNKEVVTNEKNHIQNFLRNMQREQSIPNISFLKNFWTNLANLLTKSKMKSVVILFYLLYLSTSMWGFTKLSYRATLDNNLIDGSYRHSYFTMFKDYYYHYQYRLQLFITEELDYADPKVQQKVEEMLHAIESDPLIANSDLTESWLRSYLEFLSDRRTVLFLTGYNMTNTKDFISVYRQFFLRVSEAKRFKPDLAYDENYTKIVSSRFIIQTNVTRDGNHFYNQLKNLRKYLRNATYSVIIYHPLLYFFDIIDEIPSITCQTLLVISIAVLIICVILLPSVLCIGCVLFSIISVGVGVMGYLFLLNVSLGITSISVLIMVFGLSVDYASHVSCAYLSLKEEDPNKRLSNAVSMTGMPIFQGSATTGLVVIVFAHAPSIELLITMKIITIASFISAIHGIIFIPVIMSVLDAMWQRFSKRNQPDKNNSGDNNSRDRQLRTRAENISVFCIGNGIIK